MGDNAHPDGLVSLGAAIEALRAELAEAAKAGAGRSMRFRPGPVELSVQATVTWTAGAKTGLKWWLIEAGAEGSRQSATVQTLKLVLQPVAPDQTDVLLSGDDPRRKEGRVEE